MSLPFLTSLWPSMSPILVALHSHAPGAMQLANALVKTKGVFSCPAVEHTTKHSLLHPRNLQLIFQLET